MSHFFRSATLFWMDKYKCQEYEHRSNFQTASEPKVISHPEKIFLRHRARLDLESGSGFDWESGKCDWWGQTWLIPAVTTIWHRLVKMTYGNTDLNNGPIFWTPLNGPKNYRTPKIMKGSVTFYVSETWKLSDRKIIIFEDSLVKIPVAGSVHQGSMAIIYRSPTV